MKPVTRPLISPPTCADNEIFVALQVARIYIVCPRPTTTNIRMRMKRSKLNPLRKLPTYFFCRFSLIIQAPYVEVMIMVEYDISDH